jgi:hypothetical protein
LLLITDSRCKRTWPLILFAMFVFPGLGAVFFTINLRVKGAGRKSDPASQLTTSWSDFLLDFLMLIIAFAVYAMILIGISCLPALAHTGRVS